MPELRAAALRCLRENDPLRKVACTRALAPTPGLDVEAILAEPAGLPGRPLRPHLVPPAQLPRRSVHTRTGHGALLHALAHIEFNAINLALDAIWRFAGMPRDYYLDWLKVAREEAHHFSLVVERLASLGRVYGDFAAHDGLWEMAEKTRDDVLARMALVPRTLEARGLDASPAIRDKLARVGDAASAAVVDVILRDEIGHVAIGNHWFNHLCRQKSLQPLQIGAELAARYGAPVPRAPFNLEARRAAGFSANEIDALLAKSGPQ